MLEPTACEQRIKVGQQSIHAGKLADAVMLSNDSELAVFWGGLGVDRKPTKKANVKPATEYRDSKDSRDSIDSHETR